MPETNTKDLLQRLQALEAENERLKKEQTDAVPDLRVVETEWKGHPMLKFQIRNARPFSMRIKKLKAIMDGWNHVETFLGKHQADAPGTNEQI